MDGSTRGTLAHGPGEDARAFLSPVPHGRSGQGATAQPSPSEEARSNLVACLLARGAITRDQLSEAELSQRSVDLPLAEILLARGCLGEADLLSAQAEAYGFGLLDSCTTAPEPDMASQMPREQALSHDAVPWFRFGPAVVVATSRPDRVDAIRASLAPGTRLIATLAPRAAIAQAHRHLYGRDLARRAEGQVPHNQSCRSWNAGRAGHIALLCGALILGLAVLAPVVATALLFGVALFAFMANITLKIAAFASTLRADRIGPHAGEAEQAHDPAAALLRAPIVTLLVPLYKEREVASTLIRHLSKLDYPPERLDVILVVEEDDAMTRAALDDCAAPSWVRCVIVPPGHPRTKPRALNYALNFARGDIVGVYDAEDRPSPDQIRRVVQRFAEVGPDVACLQGRLDYYNAGHNWLSRCFAIEYANWFRVLLPGVQKLGLFVPLGGTTLFLRRKVLEEVGGWDAHNVTEDAELGLRLTRRGYRTEIVTTTTYEEANAALFPWISQRSRWQKGYLMTYATAMRDIGGLWQDLGSLKFFAFQVQVLGAVLGFLCAPLLWSLIVKPFGVAHPLDAFISPMGYGVLSVIMISSVVASIALSIRATRSPHLRGLRPWILVSEAYFVFATVSAWLALAEMILKPFWWAKTHHGQFGGVAEPEIAKTPA